MKAFFSPKHAHCTNQWYFWQILINDVIATRCGGPEEIITDGIDGFLVEKENPEAMADKLEKLINNPKESEKIPTAAYQTATTHYSLESVSKSLSKTIDSCLEG